MRAKKLDRSSAKFAGFSAGVSHISILTGVFGLYVDFGIGDPHKPVGGRWCSSAS